MKAKKAWSTCMWSQRSTWEGTETERRMAIEESAALKTMAIMMAQSLLKPG